MIEVNALTVRLGGVAVVNDLSFEIPPGGSLALWGTNGAGKTTALRAMLGLLPFDGSILLGGLDIARFGRRSRSLVGYVPQQLAFWDDLGTLECLQFIARLRRAPIAEAATLLERVDLSDHAHKSVGALSGGMQQRLALAAALLGDPPILLLDEPTSGLDAGARADFLGLLADLREAGKTVVLTSHRLREVEALVERVIVLESGVATLECGADQLEGLLFPDAMLRLVVAAGLETAAVDALVGGGFDAHANNRGVLVRVAAGNRAAPLACLHEAQIVIEDFSMEDGAWTVA